MKEEGKKEGRKEGRKGGREGGRKTRRKSDVETESAVYDSNDVEFEDYL